MVKKMTFSRQEIYDEVWEISVKKVAEKYDLNYGKLLKTIKQHNIPIPSSKYWVDLRTGKDIASLIIPLPSSEDEMVIVDKKREESSEVTKDKTNKKSKDTQVLKETLSKQSVDEIHMREHLHFLDKEKLDSIIKTARSYESHENKRLHKKVSDFKKKVNLWYKKERNAKRDYWDIKHEYNNMEQPKFIKDVSKDNLPRVYRLLDILVRAFELIGENIQNDLSIVIGEDIINYEIIESKDKTPHELTKKEAQELVDYNDKVKYDKFVSKPKIRKYDYTYNGKLRIKTSDGKYIKDKKDNQLENMLSDILVQVYECYLKVRTNREDREDRQRKYEEEKRKKEEYEDQVRNEKEKTRELLNTIDDYLLAQKIRSYLSFLQSNNMIDNQEEIVWILEKADWIDPTVSSENELLGKREHSKDKEDKDNFLNNSKKTPWNRWY